MRSNALPFLAALLLLSGCTTVASLWPWQMDPDQVLHVSERDEIRLTTGELDEPYEEIAIVVAYSNGGLGLLGEGLRAEARALGADAVIRIDFDMQLGGDETMPVVQSATGTAVRLLSPTSGS